MKKTLRVLPEVVFKYNFGGKVYPVKGVPKTVGITEDGKKWIAILRCKKVVDKNDGILLTGFHYIEQIFSLDNVVEGREALEKYFEGLNE